MKLSTETEEASLNLTSMENWRGSPSSFVREHLILYSVGESVNF